MTAPINSASAQASPKPPALRAQPGEQHHQRTAGHRTGPEGGARALPHHQRHGHRGGQRPQRHDDRRVRGGDAAQRQRQQHRKADHVARHRQPQQAPVRALRPGRAREQQERGRQQPRQRRAPGGDEGGRELRRRVGAGGQTRGGQRDGEDQHAQHTQPEAGQQPRIALQGVHADQPCASIGRAPAAAFSGAVEGAASALHTIHADVATSAAAITRLNHSSRCPCASQPRSSEPMSA